jgi:predicted RecA/RadA family phage recombinase
MAKSEKFGDGDDINIAVPAYAVAGSPVQVGGIVGVCETARDAAGNATVSRKGVYTLQVTGVVTLGLPIFITTATGALVVAPGAGVNLFGHAVSAKARAGVGPVDVRIAPFSVSTDTLA